MQVDGLHEPLTVTVPDWGAIVPILAQGLAFWPRRGLVLLDLAPFPRGQGAALSPPGACTDGPATACWAGCGPSMEAAGLGCVLAFDCCGAWPGHNLWEGKGWWPKPT